MKKRILLTGGNGFIGKNILESFLAEKYYIIAPSKIELNLSDEKNVDNFFSKYNFDIVIHSACKPGHRNVKDPTNVFFENTKMFFNLIKHSDKFERMINLGSGAIYDLKNYKPKMKEDYFGVNIPSDEHGFCKYVIGKYIENIDNIVDLRIFGIFGKYEDYSIRFISNALCRTLFDLPIIINQNKKFDYIFIDDLMPVLEYFIENKPQHKAYNITPDKSLELYQLAEKIKKITGKNLPIIIKEESNLEYSGDNSLLKKELDFIKFTEIDTAIKKLYNYYLENKQEINIKD